MPVDVVWDDEAKTIARQIYSGNVTVEDYIFGTDRFFELATSVPDHIVHSILDRSAVKAMPSKMVAVLRYANNHLPPNLGLRVVIKPSMFSKVVINMGKSIAPNLMQHVYLTETLEEAHALIAQHRYMFEAKLTS